MQPNLFCDPTVWDAACNLFLKISAFFALARISCNQYLPIICDIKDAMLPITGILGISKPQSYSCKNK